MDKLYIVIPAYNESANIERVIEDWYPVVTNTGADSRLLVINDGSKDNTFELLQELSQDRPQMLAVTKPNGGHGSTVLFGYRYAIKKALITFSRQIRTVRQILLNLRHSGRCETIMMPLSETAR